MGTNINIVTDIWMGTNINTVTDIWMETNINIVTDIWMGTPFWWNIVYTIIFIYNTFMITIITCRKVFVR
jgi:hypothetical protein